MTVTADTVLVQDRGLVTSTLDGQAVVMSVEAGTCFDFNRVGSAIWTMLAEPRCVDAICSALVESHAIDRATVTREVAAFLQTLLERRLLQIVPPGAVP